MKGLLLLCKWYLPSLLGVGLLLTLFPVIFAACSPISELPDAPFPTLLAPRQAAGTPTTELTDRITGTPKRPSATPEPSLSVPVPTSFIPPANPSFLGTEIPQPQEPVGAANLLNLTQTAIWGKGTIRGVAFAPSGKTFAVGSVFGVALYNMGALDQAPRWLRLEQPFGYQSMSFSQDEKYLLLTRGDDKKSLDLETGMFSKEIPEADWSAPAVETVKTNGLLVTSPDRTMQFYGNFAPTNSSELNDNRGSGERSDEFAVREVYDAKTGDLLYTLKGKVDTIQSYYESFSLPSPEGCDLPPRYMLDSLMVVASSPYQAAFSSTGDTLSVLYRPPSLYYPNTHSILRLYQTRDGALTNVIGSTKYPVETFAYAPDGKTLLITFTDGTVQLWNIAKKKPIFQSQDFSQPLISIDQTFDGKYLLSQYPGSLKIRLSQNGSLLSSFDAAEYAVSPVENRVAIGTEEGKILLYRIGTGEVTRLQGHKAPIYAMAFSPDGRFLATSSDDCTVRYWDAGQGLLERYMQEIQIDVNANPETPSRIFIKHLRFTPGMDQLFGFGSWETMVSWNIASGASRFIVPSVTQEDYRRIMTVDSHFPESVSFDLKKHTYTIDDQAFDLRDGTRLGEAASPFAAPEGCEQAGPITRDGKLEFTRGYDDREGQICILDPATKTLIQSLEIAPSAEAQLVDIIRPHLSPDNNYLYVPTRDGAIYIFQIQS